MHPCALTSLVGSDRTPCYLARTTTFLNGRRINKSVKEAICDANWSRLTWIYYSFLQLVVADPIPDLPSASGEAAQGEEEKQRRSRNDVHRGTGTGGGKKG